MGGGRLTGPGAHAATAAALPSRRPLPPPAAMLALLLAPLFLSSPGEEPARVAVAVTDDAGAPLAGATVAVHPHRGNARWTGEAVASATTDSDGAAALTVPPDPDAHKYVLVASAPGFAPFGLATPLAETGETRAALQLSPAVRPRVRVTDAAGDPVAGAFVRDLGAAMPGGDPEANGAFWRRAARNDWAGDAVGFDAAKSGVDGVLTLPPLPAGGAAYAVVEHPDFAPADVRLAAKDGVPAAVTLRPGVRVTVRVRPDATAPPAAPLEAVKIWLPIDKIADPSWLVYEPLELGPAGEGGVRSGSVTVAPGRYGLLRLYHPAARLTPHVDDEFTLNLGEDRPFEVVATAARPVSGAVRDADGEPVAGAGVSVYYQDRPADAPLGWRPAEDPDDPLAGWAAVNGLQTVTDAAGDYRTTAPAGPARVMVWNYESGERTGEGEASLDVPPPGVGPDEIVAPPVRLAPPADRPGPVTGTVLDADGTPAAGAFVRLRGALRFGRDYALTAADGTFTLHPAAVPGEGDGGPVVPLFACDPLAAFSAGVPVDLSDESARTGVVLTLAPHDPAGPHDLPPREEVERFYELDEPLALAGTPAPPLVVREALNYRDPPTWEALRGRVVLLDVWATWCGGCHLDFPLLEDVRRIYAGRAEALTLHDNSVLPDAVRAHVAAENVTLPVLLDAGDGATLRGLGSPGGRPTFYLVGPDGVVRRAPGDGGGRLTCYLLENVRAAVLQE